METQKELIKLYINLHGSIVPARMGGKHFAGNFFGSETSKRCREMRRAGILTSCPWKENPKFEEFFYPSKQKTMF